MKARGLLLILLAFTPAVLAQEPTGEEMREFRLLSQLQRTQAQGAWQKTVGLLETIARERRVPLDSVAQLNQNQQVIERAAVEVVALPAAAGIMPIKERLASAYQAESQLIDGIFQLILVDELTPAQRTNLIEKAKRASLLIQEADRAISP